MRQFGSEQINSPWRLVAAAGLATNAAIHIDLAPSHLAEARYVGVLFIALALSALLLALLLVLNDSAAAWSAVAVVNLAALLAFIASRTVGLPQIADDIGDWTGLMGLETLFVEVLAIALAADALQFWRLRRRRAPANQEMFHAVGKTHAPANH